MSTLLIHHHDLDGYLAGDIALLHHPEATALSLNYDDPAAIPALEALAGYSLVIVVDYSLPPETMLQLFQDGRLLWIDHHISSIRKSEAHGYDQAPGLRITRTDNPPCGAELAWQFFEQTPVPRMLKLTGDFDTYRNSHAPEFQSDVMPFFYGTQLVFDRIKPGNFHQPDFLLPDAAHYQNDAWCDELIHNGRLIQAYNRKYYAGLLRESAFVRHIWGLRVLCFNCAGHGSSNMQPAFDPALHDAMLLYSFNGKRWSYGLYTDDQAKPDLDLSRIANQYGGGGHRSACGFSTTSLLPELLAEE